jgi:aminoglycoside phosphotransferase (APT) family kinase protein
MHAEQVATDADLVRRLIAAQFPRWSDLSIALVSSYGTDHDLYRLGDHLVARLPHIGWATAQPAREHEWLPRLATRLPIRLPVPVALGEPGEGYPYPWAIHEWLPGEAAEFPRDDTERVAVDLARFIVAMQRLDLAGAPARAPGVRSGPLADGDAGVRDAIARLGGQIDGTAALRVWQAALDAPSWLGPDVWGHGDLLPGNLLLIDGALSGIIDFSSLGTGDPAGDLLPAWNLFTGARRARFRAEVGADDAAWLRGRGWALRKVVSALPYYRDTHPGMIRQAQFALDQILADAVAE